MRSTSMAAALAIAAVIPAPSPMQAQAPGAGTAQGAWGGKTNGLGHYADVNGIKLYYETHGTGRPLILLHGGLGAIEMFGPNLPALAKGRQLIAVDLQGHDADRRGGCRHIPPGPRRRAVRPAGRRPARRRMGWLGAPEVEARHSPGADALHDLQRPAAGGCGDSVPRRTGEVGHAIPFDRQIGREPGASAPGGRSGAGVHAPVPAALAGVAGRVRDSGAGIPRPVTAGEVRRVRCATRHERSEL